MRSLLANLRILPRLGSKYMIMNDANDKDIRTYIENPKMRNDGYIEGKVLIDDKPPYTSMIPRDRIKIIVY